MSAAWRDWLVATLIAVAVLAQILAVRRGAVAGDR